MLNKVIKIHKKICDELFLSFLKLFLPFRPDSSGFVDCPPAANPEAAFVVFGVVLGMFR
jgi:hypothetical protein